MSSHQPFWEDAKELRAFMRHLYLRGWLDSEQSMLTFLEKPWKYHPEYREWWISKEIDEIIQRDLEELNA